ncbi:uncharacterized protein B0H64DRAFT_426197 [Chaetomium fimeti]|uniref:Uncharacterized protein n=1 Tax=Chaetomium fimeti TaxID=1854472 RepID=A0AAE0HC20_9PEZI|nr:hypothetical protein B0H64DRAFT_426197 [Chaetomium fimeti]
MLSHLRFNRRGPSNPTSPLPEQAPGWDATVAQREHPQQRPRDVSPRPDARPRSPNPPTLPPITRVASTGSDHFFTPHDDTPPPSQDAHQPPARAGYDEDNKAGFIGGVALQNYRKAVRVPQSSQAPQGPSNGMTMAGQVPGNQLSRAKPPPPPINTGVTARRTVQGNKQTKPSWFSTPTDLQGPGGAGKRPAGTRLISEPALVPAAEPQKGRKGLPFLKNPMSSLLRLRATTPRIKGTRIHDFSAPRPKKTVSGDAASTTKQEAISPVSRSGDRGESGPPSFGEGPVVCSPAEPAQGAIDLPKHSQNGDSQLGPEGRRPSSSTVRPRQSTSLAPPNDGSSVHTSSSGASRRTQTATRPPTASTSIKTTASRQLSKSDMSRGNSVASAVPKHMKSTSSRFSFDMIGAAEQERVLEERHRQREQDKKASGDPGDARFDDFDEDFDYDAMMDDDGLEERIPGVNADYEYDDYGEGLDDNLEADLDDPDNDQENFAGFTFQRSNPVSSLASPHTPGMVATPRDAAGNVIGFATTKDTTPTAESPMFPGHLHVPKEEDSLAAPDESIYRPSDPPAATAQQPALRSEHDDIYFDDGLADELDFEHDGTVFDESIFDNNDTDRYGRPIPGAFAQAKEAMQSAHQQQQQQVQQQQGDEGAEAEQQQPPSREPDLASTTLSQPAVVDAANQPSPSINAQQPPVREMDDEVSPPKDSPEPEADPEGQDLAYQAALAAAAQIAAASGKFTRSASPEALAALGDAPLDELAGYEDDGGDGYVDDYAIDDLGDNFDDFDFDDEAIIAEANASALANDSDGFYGQEFGFYSAPLTHQPHNNNNHHQPSTAAGTTATPSGVLTSENLFQYANGGFFGPASAGLDRSTSGRVVREPNLTPITERSEYSNRNSVMSFTLPPAIGNGGSERNSITSPGLAQLALLPPDADDLNMGMSALMKLRSRAWGGSQPSLVSSREGSPRSERASLPSALGPLPPLDAGGSPYGTVPAHLAGHVRVNSGLSLWSTSEAAEEDGKPPVNGNVSGVGSPVHIAMAMGMSSLRSQGQGQGQGQGLAQGVVLPPRPGIAPVAGPTGWWCPRSRSGPTRCSCPRSRRCLCCRRLHNPCPRRSAGRRARLCWRARRLMGRALLLLLLRVVVVVLRMGPGPPAAWPAGLGGQYLVPVGGGGRGE